MVNLYLYLIVMTVNRNRLFYKWIDYQQHNLNFLNFHGIQLNYYVYVACPRDIYRIYLKSMKIKYFNNIMHDGMFKHCIKFDFFIFQNILIEKNQIQIIIICTKYLTCKLPFGQYSVTIYWCFGSTQMPIKRAIWSCVRSCI